jgi:hypothetical protein
MYLGIPLAPFFPQKAQDANNAQGGKETQSHQIQRKMEMQLYHIETGMENPLQ